MNNCAELAWDSQYGLIEELKTELDAIRECCEKHIERKESKHDIRI